MIHKWSKGAYIYAQIDINIFVKLKFYIYSSNMFSYILNVFSNLSIIRKSKISRLFKCSNSLNLYKVPNNFAEQ